MSGTTVANGTAVASQAAQREETVVLREYQPSEPLPLDGGEIELLCGPLRNVLSVVPDRTPGLFRLVAGAYVGTVLLKQRTVFIRPKVESDSLLAMIEDAWDLELRPRGLARYAFGDDLLELLADRFAAEAHRIISAGMHRRYVAEEDNLPVLRGRLNLGRHLATNLAQPGRLWCAFDEFTADLIENRTLKYVSHWLALVMRHRPALSNRLYRNYAQAEGVTYTPVTSTDVRQVVYTPLNERYRPALRLAAVILDHLAAHFHPGHQPLAAFTIDMNALFQRFLTVRLERELRRYGLTLRAEPETPLDRDREIRMQPDIVVYRERRPVLVIDAKYKRTGDEGARWHPGDVYQMLAYCRALGLQRGVLVYAAGSERRLVVEAGGRTEVEEWVLEMEGGRRELERSVAALAYRIGVACHILGEVAGGAAAKCEPGVI